MSPSTARERFTAHQRNVVNSHDRGAVSHGLLAVADALLAVADALGARPAPAGPSQPLARPAKPAKDDVCECSHTRGMHDGASGGGLCRIGRCACMSFALWTSA